MLHLKTIVSAAVKGGPKERKKDSMCLGPRLLYLIPDPYIDLSTPFIASHQLEFELWLACLETVGCPEKDIESYHP